MMPFSPTIIIVNYNAGSMLRQCIESLLVQTHREFHVVIIDNASTDNSCVNLPEDSRITLVKSEVNLGFARANNAVGLTADSEWLITLNPDTIARPDWLQQLGAARLRYPDVQLFGSTQLCAKNPTQADGLGDEYFCSGIAWRRGNGAALPELLDDTEVFGPCAAAAMYRSTLFKKLGGFAEDFFCYMEDVDFAFRAQLLGARSMQLAQAQVFHHGYAISGVRSDFTLYHCTRNMIWTYWRCMPSLLLWLTLPQHVGMVCFILLWSVKQKRFQPVHNGVVAALDALRVIIKQRREIQSMRQVSAMHIARRMIWNPLQIIRWRKRVAVRDNKSQELL